MSAPVRGRAGNPPAYFGQIGLRYLLIPTMAIAIGYSTGRAAAEK